MRGENVKITVAMENSVPPRERRPFRAEHGLAMLIECEGQRILFDTGQSGEVVRNLSLLSVHPSQLDAVVLSHGHSDHAGGLAAVLTHAGKSLPIYAHPAIFSERYSSRDGVAHSAGLPFSREHLESLGAVFYLSQQPQNITRALTTSGTIPRLTEFEHVSTDLVIPSENGVTPDPLSDDLSLFYYEAGNLVVILGCAHAGMVNIIRYGMQQTGASRLIGMIGGTHLGPADSRQIAESLSSLEGYHPEWVMANHCTGFSIMAELAQRFGSRFKPAAIGVSVTV
jgi:7,8-dihydropterin-6-yl-methyl-4-(beta-D-ribofuranosyl)aminobenzene 5'-phosphate synthase